MWHIVDFGLGDVRVLYDTHVDELENDFGPNLGAKLIASFIHKHEAEDYLDVFLDG